MFKVVEWCSSRSRIAEAPTLARGQQAKSMELGAAVSVCQLQEDRSMHEAERQQLAEIYGWFTEWFETADPQESTPQLTALGKVTRSDSIRSSATRALNRSRSIARAPVIMAWSRVRYLQWRVRGR
jgi:hypothetical protein